MTSARRSRRRAAWEHWRHRQGARRDPPRDAHRDPRSICRARPAHRRAPVPARQDRICRRQAEGRVAASGACLHRRCDGGGRARRDESLRRRARDVSRLQARSASARPLGPAESGWFGSEEKRARAGERGPEKGSAKKQAIPIRGINSRSAGAVRAEWRRGAGRPHRRHRHAGRGDHDLSDPVAGAEGFRGDARTLARRALGRRRSDAAAFSGAGSCSR
jgi:hypothetical protein